MTAVRLARLAALLPYLLSVFAASLTPTRALLLAWLPEAACPGKASRAETGLYALRHFSPWLLLHGLRADGPAWLGLGLLLAFVLTRRLWAGQPRRFRAGVIAALLFLPALSGLALEAAGSGAAEGLSAFDAWHAAGAAGEAASGALPDLREGRYAELPYRLPLRLWPWALSESPRRTQARTLALALLLWLGAAVFPRAARRRTVLLGGALLAAAGGAAALSGPKAVVVFFRQAGPPPQDWLVEVYGQGGDLWDPGRGLLLPPGGGSEGHFQIRPVPRQRVYRVVSALPWALARPLQAGFQPPDEAEAWLETGPGGEAASGGEPGALGLLRHWAAGETGAEPGARWLLGPDRVLYRLPPG